MSSQIVTVFSYHYNKLIISKFKCWEKINISNEKLKEKTPQNEIF